MAGKLLDVEARVMYSKRMSIAVRVFMEIQQLVKRRRIRRFSKMLVQKLIAMLMMIRLVFSLALHLIMLSLGAQQGDVSTQFLTF